jgi:hypothetical protein
MSRLTKEQKERIRAYKAKIAEIMVYGKTSEHGLTTVELRQYFADLMMKRMNDWIDGQTCALTPDGKMVIYPEDIQRFVAGILDHVPTYFD